VVGQLKLLNSLGPADLSAALQLPGLCALIGVEVSAISAKWPGRDQIDALLDYATPPSDSVTIGHIQVQLWVGLREMARLCQDAVQVRPSSGEEILTLWSNSKGVTDRYNSLNASMIEWSERCRQNGWILIHDHTSLASSLDETE
jgi:hypothetical protein